MKQLAKSLCLALLLSSPLKIDADCNNTNTACANPKTLYVPISQGSNLYTQYHKVFYNDSDDDCDWSADLSLTYRYMQTRNEDKISAMILNADCNNPLQFQGIFEEGRNDGKALVAKYFGFSDDANFTVEFQPRIQNNVFDLQFALGGEKVWFQANAPLVHTKWRINKNGIPTVNGTLGEDPFQAEGTATITSPGTVANPYVFSDVSPNTGTDKDITDWMQNIPIDLTNPDGTSIYTNSLIDINTCELPSITSGTNSVNLTNNFAAGIAAVSTKLSITANNVDAAETLSEGLLGDKTYGTIAPRKYGKIDCSCDDNTEWKIADIHLQLGYDFYKHDNKHFGAYIKAVLPTGTKLDESCNNYLFSPIVGNGNHFELGAGISGHLQLWDNDESALNAYVDGYITHMFKSSQCRTYDMTGLPMSRYAMVKQLTPGASANPATPNMPTSFTNITQAGDPYTYSGIVYLGDINTVCQDISADIRGEAILDLIYSYKNWEFGAGYAFSGQSKEKANGCEDSANSYKYGFLGTAGTATLSFIGTSLANDPRVNVFNTTYASGNSIYVKTSSSVVDPLCGAYIYVKDGDPKAADDTNTFSLPSVDNRSGLMDGQILHRIFGHIDYVWSDCDWMPQLGVLGSFGFSQDSYRTAEYWDLGARFGFSF